jgi:hypothetical protein
MLQVTCAQATNRHKKTEESVVIASHIAYAKNMQALHSTDLIRSQQ